MDELTTTKIQLPDSLEDLSRFVLFTQERINAIRAEIRAISKLRFAKEVETQKKQELQELSEVFIDAQVRIGELTKLLEKDVGGRPKNSSIQIEEFSTGKGKAIKKLDLTNDQVSQFERMASNPKAVEQAKEEARESEKPVTRRAVMKLIEAGKPDKVIDVTYHKPDAGEIAEDYTEAVHNTIDTIKLYRAITDLAEILRENISPREYAELLINDFITAADKEGFLFCLDIVLTNLQSLKAAITSYKRMGAIR